MNFFKKLIFFSTIGFCLSLQIIAQELKECKSERDKKSRCVQKEYYSNGNLKYEIPYKNSKKDGIVKFYDENGNLRAKFPYKKIKKKGLKNSIIKMGILK